MYKTLLPLPSASEEPGLHTHCCPRTLPCFRPHTHAACLSTQVSESSPVILLHPIQLTTHFTLFWWQATVC